MRKHLYWGLVVGVVLAAGSGCSGKSGDDDDDGGSSGDKGSGTTSADAVAKCDALVGLYCPAVMDCLVKTGAISASQRDANVDSCTTSAMSALDCSRAASVTSSYDSCITALNNLDCDAVTAAVNSNNAQNILPGVCAGVILLNP